MTQPTLRADLRHWIAEETSEAVADRFFPLVENALSGLGHDLSTPASEARAREVME